MVKSILIGVILFSLNMGASAGTQPIYADCVKGDIQCEKNKKKGMEMDRKRYQKWCAQHPKKCSQKTKMFE